MYTAAHLRRVFGTPTLPTIRLSLAEAAFAAQQSAGKLSISGVQPKLSLGLEGGELVVRPEGGRFILKPQTMTFPELPENEHLCMQLAAECGLRAAPNVLIRLADGSWAYLVRRFDRAGAGRKLPCEDMAQILGKTKYEGSYEQVGKALRRYCSFPDLEAQYLFERVLFCFITGNGDQHLKNFSLLTRDETVALSPAYDLVSSRIVIPNEAEELALSLNGRRNRIARRDFAGFADALGVALDFADSTIEAYARRPWIRERIERSQLSSDRRNALVGLVRERLDRLGVHWSA